MTPEGAASFKRTLELGKKIAEDLDQNDVLGRWMAHHISDLITRSEGASHGQADDIRHETAQVIIALWKNRLTLPAASNPPLASFEPVLRALERLSEPQSPWAFYGVFPRGHEPSESEMVAAPLLETALRVEDGVRRAVRELVALAAQDATDREAKWLKFSEGIEEDDQRAALGALRELARSLEAYTGDADTHANAAPGISKLIATLQHAEEELAAARRVLEERLPGFSSDS